MVTLRIGGQRGADAPLEKLKSGKLYNKQINI
jgi:hypothetical protein